MSKTRIFHKALDGGYRSISAVIRFNAVTRFRKKLPMPIVTQLKHGHTASRDTSLRCSKDGERETKGRAEVLVIKAFRQTYIAETGYPGIGAFHSCIPAGGCLQGCSNRWPWRSFEPQICVILRIGRKSRAFFRVRLCFRNPSLPGLIRPTNLRPRDSLRLLTNLFAASNEPMFLFLFLE